MQTEKGEKMKTEMRAIDSIKLYPKNPRKNDKAIDAVAKSLKEFGWRQPIVVDKDGIIIVGHTRWKAAKKLGMVEVPVHVASELTPAQAKAYRLADNQTNTIASWDLDLLPIELGELKDLNVDLGSLGFSDAEIDKFGCGKKGLTDPDAVPEVKEPITKTGDLWILGEHRLLCGDCTIEANVQRLMAEEKARLIFTSPPYYNAREYAHWDTIKKYLDDMKVVISYIAKNTLDLCVVWNIGEQAVHRLDLSSLTSVSFQNLFGLQFRDKIAWLKSGGVFDVPRNAHIAKGFYYPAFGWESILIFTKGNHPKIESRFISELTQDCIDVWAIRQVSSQNESGGFHCAAFPIALAIKALKCYSPENTICYDPFCGSGTTIIACEQLGRRCFAMEIEPRYVDVAVKRWEDFTGKKAVLEK